MEPNKNANISEKSIDLAILKKLEDFYIDYIKTKEVTASEYIEKIISENPDEEIPKTLNDTFRIFFHFTKHLRLLKDITTHFFTYFNIIQRSRIKVKLLIYYIIFHSHGKPYEDIKYVVLNFGCVRYKKIINYLIEEDNIINLTLTACKYFDEEYVLKEIMEFLVQNKPLLLKLHNDFSATERKPKPKFSKECIKKHVIEKKVFEKQAISKSIKKRVSFPISRCEVPKSTYYRMGKTRQLLERKFAENRKNAEELFTLAQQVAFACAKRKSITYGEVCGEKTKKFKHKPVPKYKEVKFKTNATSLMRQAAIIAKEQEEEVKRLEELCEGGYDDSVFNEFEEDARREKKNNEAFEAERKKLLVMLAHEAAVLSKQTLIKVKQERVEQIKEERLELLRKLDIHREEEEQRVKEIVMKCQGIQAAARQAEEKLLDEKRGRAKLIGEESRKLKKKAEKIREEEMKKKEQLIKEIRALGKIKDGSERKFDKTLSPSYGLLCEMSIAELEERLQLMKFEMEEELEAKKKAILEKKKKQEEYMQCVRKFVEETKPAKKEKRNDKLDSIDVKFSPELVEMRERLEAVRSLRKGMGKVLF